MRRRTQAIKNTTTLWIAFFLLLALAAFLLWQELRPADASQQGSNAATGITVTMINVGQGDSILIYSKNHAILMDAGEYSAADEVIAAIRQAGIKKLDAVILTHPHADHYGGIRSVLGAFPTAEFITCALPEEQIPTTTAYEKLLNRLAAEKIPGRYAAVGMSWELDGATLTVLGPAEGKTYENLNNLSVITRLDYGKSSFLFTGDAEELAENDLLTSDAKLDADVLKVGHHGSGTSSSERFLQTVSPKTALISVGEGNDYGLPNEFALRRLKASGATLYRTDIQGNITLQSDGETVTVKTEK